LEKRRTIVDTNVFVGALLRSEGYNRKVLRSCLEERSKPIMGQALLSEYEDLLGRTELFRNSLLSARERMRLFEAFLSMCEWVRIYYGWRPNLRDEADNHLLELAIAGGASSIVTHNVADFRGAELQFPHIRILSPREFIKELV
jgi:putative PIN family toxin of toxin-antitoxin system